MAQKKKTGLGLLPRLYLGVFIPILVAFTIIGIMIFFTWKLGGVSVPSVKDIGAESLQELSTLAAKESKSSLGDLGEKVIKDRALSVAAQMEIFVKSHPRMKREEMLADPWLKEIAIQKVGETGYTTVHDSKGVIVFHADPKVIGADFHQYADKFPGFWKIIEKSLAGPASGYYTWRDPDGKIRPKYMYVTPVGNTELIVASTTNIEEFTEPSRAIEAKMTQIERSYLDQYGKKFQFFFLVILIILFVLLVVIYLYSNLVIRPIRHLSEVANKISMGDLDAPIRINAKGEVAVLAESIERMQTSVKAAIERLQRRREAKPPISAIEKG